MRPLTRLAVLGTLTALAATPNAFAANSATAKVTGKAGSSVVAGPARFQLTVNTPDTPSDPSGNTRIQAIQARLPSTLLFNTVLFGQCSTSGFISNGSCPASTRLGSATLTADGGPDVGIITAKTELYIGTGFAVLARVQTDKPAVIDESIVGSIRSSATQGYGLELYIPVPKSLQEPVPGLFPSVKSVVADFAGPKKKVSVKGFKGKVTVPLVGLGPCSGKLNFQVNTLYGNAVGNVTKTDGASTSATCKK